jgi:hypothetical protein
LGPASATHDSALKEQDQGYARQCPPSRLALECPAGLVCAAVDAWPVSVQVDAERIARAAERARLHLGIDERRPGVMRTDGMLRAPVCAVVRVDANRVRTYSPWLLLNGESC